MSKTRQHITREEMLRLRAIQPAIVRIVSQTHTLNRAARRRLAKQEKNNAQN